MSLRRIQTVGALTVAAIAVTQPAYAHGIGGRADLPVPLSLFLVGAGVALVVSFVGLAVLWPEARLQEEREPRTLGFGLRVPRLLLRTVGLAALVLVIVAGLADSNETVLNIAPFIVWILFWLVVPFASVALGNLWSAMSPWDTLGGLLAIGETERPELLARFGVWPAAAAFAAFTWLELVYPDSGDPRTLTAAAVLYSGYVIGMMAWAGRSSGQIIGDAFTMYNGAVSAIAPFTSTGDRLAWRGWLRGLTAIPEWKGLATFVILMIGTVSYDGLSGSEWWFNLTGAVRGDLLVGTAGLVGTILLIGAGYWLASLAAARLGGDADMSATDVARNFAHTLVPIAVAYAVAHYFTLILFEGQQLLAAASDPFARGWDLFGTAEWRVNVFLSPEAVWYTQLAVIVLGHIAGVVLAHDRALVTFKPENAVRTQYAMLILMVGLTSLGLFILAG